MDLRFTVVSITAGAGLNFGGAASDGLLGGCVDSIGACFAGRPEGPGTESLLLGGPFGDDSVVGLLDVNHRNNHFIVRSIGSSINCIKFVLCDGKSSVETWNGFDRPTSVRHDATVRKRDTTTLDQRIEICLKRWMPKEMFGPIEECIDSRSVKLTGPSFA